MITHMLLILSALDWMSLYNTEKKGARAQPLPLLTLYRIFCECSTFLRAEAM